MKHPQHTRWRVAARRTFRLLGVTAVVLTGMASDCEGPESVTERSVVTRIDPSTRTDTTFATDTIVYEGPAVVGTNGFLTDFDVRWETSQPTVARLLDPPVQRYARSGSIETPIIRPTMRVEVLRGGEAVVTMTPLNVNFANNQPLRHTATIVALTNKPTTLNVNSTYNLRVGDTLTLSASPRGASAGTITTGSAEWRIANTAVARLYRAFDNAWPEGTPANPTTLGPNQRVGVRAMTPGTTQLEVIYTGGGGVRLQRTITINVTANAARVAIDREMLKTVTYANAATFIIDARVLDAAGSPLDPTTIRYVSRDPSVATLSSTNICPGPFTTTACSAVVQPNDAEIRRRGGVARVWVVATSGATPADSVELTIYPAVASLAITPAPSTLVLGGSADYTVVARDADGKAIPAAAFEQRGGISIDIPISGPTSGYLQASRSGKPPLVTNLTVREVPASGTGSVDVSATLPIDGPAFTMKANATINLRSVARVALTPASATFPLGGESVPFSAQLFDAANRPVNNPGIRVDWSVADPSVAVAVTTVDGGALARGVRVGRTDIVATAQGVEGRAAFEVTTAAAQPTLVLSPTTLPLTVGQTGVITATVVNGTPPINVFWSTRNSAVASFTVGTGQATIRGVAPGDTWIDATYSNGTVTVRDSARVRVEAPASRVRAILLEPTAAEITAPASLQYRVLFFDSLGARTTVETGGALEFSSSNLGAATIDAALGRATGMTAGGNTTIRARYLLNGQEIATSSSPLTVYQPTGGHFGSVEISTAGNAREVRVGQELLFQLIVRDVAGTQVTSGVTGLEIRPDSIFAPSPYLEILPATGMGPGYFYRIRGKAVTPATVPVTIRADVTGAAAAIPVVVRP